MQLPKIFGILLSCSIVFADQESSNDVLISLPLQFFPQINHTFIIVSEKPLIDVTVRTRQQTREIVEPAEHTHIYHPLHEEAGAGFIQKVSYVVPFSAHPGDGFLLNITYSYCPIDRNCSFPVQQSVSRFANMAKQFGFILGDTEPDVFGDRYEEFVRFIYLTPSHFHPSIAKNEIIFDAIEYRSPSGDQVKNETAVEAHRAFRLPVNLVNSDGNWKVRASIGEATKEVSYIVQNLRNPLGVNLRLHTPHQIDVSNKNVLIIICGRYTDGSLVFGTFFVSISVVTKGKPHAMNSISLRGIFIGHAVCENVNVNISSLATPKDAEEY